MNRPLALPLLMIIVIFVVLAFGSRAQAYTCAVVRAYVSQYGPAVSDQWARANLSRANRIRALACFGGRKRTQGRARR